MIDAIHLQLVLSENSNALWGHHSCRTCPYKKSIALNIYWCLPTDFSLRF